MLSVRARRNTIFALAGFLLVGGVCLAWVFRAQILCLANIRHLESTSHFLEVVPVPLDLPPGDSGHPGLLSRFGCSFSIPWAGVTRQEGLSGPAYATSPDGRAVFFNDPSRVSLLASLRGHFDIGPAMSDAAKVDFAMLESIVSAAPSSFTLMLSAQESVELLALLKFKRALLLEEAATGIYSFETATLRGFQIGRPGQAHNIQILAFHSGRPIEVYVRAAERELSSLTQEDVNVILTTFTCEGRAAQ